MSIGRTFGIIAVTCSPLIAGCNPDPKNNDFFEGKVGQDHVRLYEKHDKSGGWPNYLEVVKPDGRIIVYADIGSDDDVDYFTITENGETIRHPRNRFEQNALDAARIKYRQYLRAIGDSVSARVVAQLD